MRPRGDKKADDGFSPVPWRPPDGADHLPDKARAVRPNRDRRPLAVVQHTASTRFCSRVVRRFIGMSAIATVSRFIMIEGEDEFTARRPFLARRTNGSSERFTRRQTALAITPWLSHTN